MNVLIYQYYFSYVYRFYDVVFEHANDSAIQNLTCGKITFENKSNWSWWSKKENHWQKDSNCIKEWHPQGITCVCKTVGTYALLKIKHFFKVSVNCNTKLNVDYSSGIEEITNGNLCISPGMGSLLILHCWISICILICMKDTSLAGPFPGGV